MILTVTLNVAIDKLYVVDSLMPGEVIRVKDCTYNAGGKGINISKVVNLLKEKVTAIGFTGGYSGSFIKESVIKAGINEAFINVKGESRTSINVFDRSCGKVTEFLEPGMAVTEENIRNFTDLFYNLVDKCEIVTISGSVPRGIDDAFYQQLIIIAKSKCKKVILDTSGKLLQEGLKALPYAIKPNIYELTQLLGTEINNFDDIVNAAEVLHNRGIAIVIVSLGKDGALVVCDEGVYRGTTPDVKVVNSVGCGDSMVAAFAVGLVRNLGIEETLKLAMAVSTANALTKENGHFLQKDLDILMDEVKVIKL